MEQFKFMAYLKEINCIVAVESLHLIENKPFIIAGGNKHFLEDIELMQYTGLEDKESVEIYVGDVLKDNQNDLLGTVVFEDGAFFVNWENGRNLLIDWADECTIVDNRYILKP